jgi:hypothetical protein
MKRTNHSLPNTPTSPKELLKHIVFHEAGHVVAIYLRNKQQQLPQVFFQIIITAAHNYWTIENTTKTAPLSLFLQINRVNRLSPCAIYPVY